MSVAQPLSMWTAKGRADRDESWVVFKTHDEARAFLSLSYPSITILPAIEADLELLERFWRADIAHKLDVHRDHQLRMSLSTPDLHRRATLAQSPSSANPPNPRTSFRSGDWICSSPSCAAHNFGRNLACRGCGCPRSERSAALPSTRFPSSPRFIGSANATSPYVQPSIPNTTSGPHYPSGSQGARHLSPSLPALMNVKSPSPSNPLLTPSGRAFAVGGRVQNVSGDPLIPCVIFWPDNEPFPEQGQIRPSHLTGVQVCHFFSICNYLNWRRRKVCQTCFPYAEGNGDSISAAVQAERIHLLTSLLARNQLSVHQQCPPEVPSQPVASIQPQRSPMDRSRSLQVSPRPRSQLDLAARYPDSQFIYETSGPHSSSSASFPSMKGLEDDLPSPSDAPNLLPSFLQDIVQSPTLSPTSTSSAELSIEEYEANSPSSQRSSLTRDRLVLTDDSISHSPLGNIWKLNDEETKGGASVALPTHEDLVGSRNSSREF
ncbi:hypothetical protein F5J12DRAFT_907322 [Pisolithus orientalis]|uniref:uncharacterized protein n=1 Tax=Pisolithus orientalis TaxID=936130 RepID=UPI002224BB33|nr:uncharacterized protein F5J12DRAFT_907322 [Pisolithus orientalis]KAI5993714.1 hypothetical protein F5J12DRAFT_907322 [Pisolithus orientalis]